MLDIGTMGTSVEDYARLQGSLPTSFPADYIAMRAALIAEMLAGYSCEFLGNRVSIKPFGSPYEWCIIYKFRIYCLYVRVGGKKRAAIMLGIAPGTAKILNNSLLWEGQAVGTIIIKIANGFEVRLSALRTDRLNRSVKHDYTRR